METMREIGGMKKGRIYVAAVLLVLVTFLCACKDEVTTKTAAQIKDIVVDGRYEIQGSYYFSEGSTTDSFTALLTNNWTVSFTDYKDYTSSCDAEFDFSKLAWADDDESNVREISEGYIIIEGMTGEDRYQLISRKGNTILYIAGPVKDKANINLYALGMGYYE